MLPPGGPASPPPRPSVPNFSLTWGVCSPEELGPPPPTAVAVHGEGSASCAGSLLTHRGWRRLPRVGGELPVLQWGRHRLGGPWATVWRVFIFAGGFEPLGSLLNLSFCPMISSHVSNPDEANYAMKH